MFESVTSELQLTMQELQHCHCRPEQKLRAVSTACSARSIGSSCSPNPKILKPNKPEEV